MFYHTFVKQQALPLSGQVPKLTAANYLRALAAGCFRALESHEFWAYVTVVGLAVGRLLRRVPRKLSSLLDEETVGLLALSVVYVAVHFALFPVMWQRFFIGPYSLGAVALLASLRATGVSDAESLEPVDQT